MNIKGVGFEQSGLPQFTYLACISMTKQTRYVCAVLTNSGVLCSGDSSSDSCGLLMTPWSHLTGVRRQKIQRAMRDLRVSPLCPRLLLTLMNCPPRNMQGVGDSVQSTGCYILPASPHRPGKVGLRLQMCSFHSAEGPSGYILLTN
jgi:hypothetical protein